VPVLVSSLVVIFAVVEVLILPFLAQTFLSHEPLLAEAWIGRSVKTDGAAVAAGGITEALILSNAAAEGVHYQPGWLLGTTAAVKVFIDLLIGIWAFVLAYIWTNHINVLPDGQRARAAEIWQRFPKFVIGFLLTFLVTLYLAVTATPDALVRLAPAIGDANTFRVIFFILTFFPIGVLSNFRELWEDGLGKLVVRRHQAAPCRLTRKAHRVRLRSVRRNEQGPRRAAAAGREEADRLEPRYRPHAAGAARPAQPLLAGRFGAKGNQPRARSVVASGRRPSGFCAGWKIVGAG
jgi:hypothetical protein